MVGNEHKSCAAVSPDVEVISRATGLGYWTGNCGLYLIVSECNVSFI